MKRKRLIVALVILTMQLACIALFSTIIFPPMLADHQAKSVDQPPISAEEFAASSETLDEAFLTVEGLKSVGEPLEVKRSSLDFSDFVLVHPAGKVDHEPSEDGDQAESSTGNSERAIVLFNHREKTDQSIVDMIGRGQLKGKFDVYEGEHLPKNISALREHFPNLDLKSTRFIFYSSGIPSWLFWIVTGIFVLQPLSMVYLFYSLVLKQNELLEGESWEEKINEDRTNSYRSSQQAMRLINHPTYFNGSLQQRAVDATYDVPATKKTKLRKTKQLMFVIAGLVANCLAVVGVTYLQLNSDLLAGLGKFGGQLLVFIPLLIMGSLIGSLRRKVVRRDEEELSREKAIYRELAFYKYHAQVLTELDFVEIGDFKQLGSPANLSRTIFLSPLGNLLVELGTQSGVPFFTLESLTNSGKLLETHSMLGPRQEITDETKAHLRQSASHLDIVKALNDHDELVAKMTFAGAILEGKFTAENFGRFLAHSAQSNKS